MARVGNIPPSVFRRGILTDQLDLSKGYQPASIQPNPIFISSCRPNSKKPNLPLSSNRHPDRFVVQTNPSPDHLVFYATSSSTPISSSTPLHLQHHLVFFATSSSTPISLSTITLVSTLFSQAVSVCAYLCLCACLSTMLAFLAYLHLQGSSI